MYDFDGDDVKAIALGKDGRVYAIANEHQSPPEVPSHSSWSPNATQPAGPAKPMQLPRPGKGTLMRFGLDGDEPKTLQEIGETMGLSRERIRQIESRAKEKLRRSREAAGLRGYLN